MSQKIDSLELPKSGQPPVFSDEEVIILSHYLAQRERLGLGLTRVQTSTLLSKIAMRKAESRGETPTPSLASSAKFARRLFRRTSRLPNAEPLFTFKPTALSPPRAKARREDVIGIFSEKVADLLDGLKIRFHWEYVPPFVLYNIDECGVDTEEAYGPVVGTRHPRHERLRSTERCAKWMTVLLTCCADGSMRGEGYGA